MRDIVPAWPSAADYLTGLSEECEALAGRATGTFLERSPAQLGWRPKVGAWSVAECLNYLLATHRLYLGSIERTLAKSNTPAAGDAAFEGGRLAGWFIAFLGPDSARKATPTRGSYAVSQHNRGRSCP